MLHRTNRPHRPAVRAVPLVQSSPSGGVPSTLRRPHLVPPLEPAADAPVVDAPAAEARVAEAAVAETPSVLAPSARPALVEVPSSAAPVAEVAPSPELRSPTGADLTDAERLVLEDLFHRASQVRQVVLALLAAGLLVLLVALMR